MPEESDAEKDLSHLRLIMKEFNEIIKVQDSEIRGLTNQLEALKRQITIQIQETRRCPTCQTELELRPASGIIDVYIPKLKKCGKVDRPENHYYCPQCRQVVLVTYRCRSCGSTVKKE